MSRVFNLCLKLRTMEMTAMKEMMAMIETHEMIETIKTMVKSDKN